MKPFSRVFLNIFLILNIIYMLLAFIIYRRFDYLMSFFRLEWGVILISTILSFAYTIFKSDKGIAILNIIVAYLLIIPSLFVIRLNFGRYLFRSAWIIYIILIIVGCIYGLALLVAQRKYKKEVDQLNELLKAKEDKQKTPDGE